MKSPKSVGAAMLMVALAAGFSFAASSAPPEPNAQMPPLQLKEYRIERAISETAAACIQCHAEQTKGIVADWAASRHAHANVNCLDCHAAGPADTDASAAHLTFDKTRITPIVSPKDCSRCHPAEAAQYAKSKHANTLEIIWSFDPWLIHGMNNGTERTTGCFPCHGTVIESKEGRLDAAVWPNVGVGRLNPDGSKGSCTSCHTRHKFSVAEARKPEACGQCHLGPDHPQIEIYDESKHGAIYHAEGKDWNWTAAPGIWTPGVDYRSPTCSVCHMSGINGLTTSHDVTERLAWETQAPLTIRPDKFTPWPAKTNWRQERMKMEKVCFACHSKAWTDGHFRRFEAAVKNYNDVYYTPAKQIIDDLYAKKLLSPDRPLDEKLEIDIYELWHYEGRRARFGAAMMAPDYAWWHGFYELKKRSMAIEEQAEQLIQSGKPAKVFEVKGTGGGATKPNFDK